MRVTVPFCTNHVSGTEASGDDFVMVVANKKASDIVGWIATKTANSENETLSLDCSQRTKHADRSFVLPGCSSSRLCSSPLCTETYQPVQYRTGRLLNSNFCAGTFILKKRGRTLNWGWRSPSLKGATRRSYVYLPEQVYGWKKDRRFISSFVIAFISGWMPIPRNYGTLRLIATFIIATVG
jgi:hypothetical protein